MAAVTQEQIREVIEEDFWQTGPDTPSGQYLRQFWQPICRSIDLPVGRAKPLKMFNEEFTIYRGQSGMPYLVGYRCAHRGTQLSTGWVEGDSIRCFFHGWMYDGSGQCVQQPPEKPSFADRIRIPSYPVEEYLGLIFAYLGGGSPPALPHFAEWENGYRTTAAVRHVNYLQSLENDSTHIHFVHRTRWGPGPGLWEKPENLVSPLKPVETEWGWMGGWRSADGNTTTVHAYGMPTVLIQAPRIRDQGPNVEQFELAWKVPVDDEWHMRFTVYPVNEPGDHSRGDENAWRRQGAKNDNWTERILSGELNVEEAEAQATEAGDGLGFQDSVSQNGQGRIWRRKTEHLGRSDVDVIMRRKMFARDIRAFLEGEGVQQWHRPDWMNINNWAEIVQRFKTDDAVM